MPTETDRLTSRRTVTIRYIAAAIIAIACPLQFGTAVGQHRALEARVDSVLHAWSGTDVPGIAVAYFEADNPVFSKAYGLANLEHRVVMSTDTPSDLGSVSKQFVGFAIALLAEKGLLDLDDDIRKYLPAVPDFGDTITIRNLLYHTSGLREIYNTLALVNWRPGDGIFQEHAQRLVSFQRELQFPPGTRYLYNNTEYMLLADIVEVITGDEFHDWMTDNVFHPLEMYDTTVMHEQGQVIPGVATSYNAGSDGRFRQMYDNSTIQGAGGIYSTVEDMVKWMRNFSTHTVGSKATIESLVTPGTLRNGDPIDYALGIVVNETRGVVTWAHGGASAGYRSAMTYLPEHQQGFVFLTNSPANGSPQGGLADVFFSNVLPPQAPDDEAGGPDAASDDDSGALSREEDAYIPLLTLIQYRGKYLSDELEVFYDVTLDGGELYLVHRWLTNQTMTLLSDDTFHLDGGPSTIAFHRDDDGSVSGFTLDTGRTIGVRFRRYADPGR